MGTDKAAEMISTAIHDMVDAVDGVSRGLKWLGNGDAATHLGALEAHGMQIEKAGQLIADAISELAEAIREHR